MHFGVHMVQVLDFSRECKRLSVEEFDRPIFRHSLLFHTWPNWCLLVLNIDNLTEFCIIGPHWTHLVNFLNYRIFTHLDLSHFLIAYLELQISDLDDLGVPGKIRQRYTILDFTGLVRFGPIQGESGLPNFVSDAVSSPGLFLT